MKIKRLIDLFLYSKIFSIFTFLLIFLYESLKLIKGLFCNENLYSMLSTFLLLIIITYSYIDVVKREKIFFGKFAILTLSGAFIVVFLKLIIKKVRPDFSSDSSFPSGHTFLAFNSFFLCFYYKKIYNIKYIFFILISILVALFRILGNKHDSIDVLFSFLIAIINFYIINYIIILYQNYFLKIKE